MNRKWIRYLLMTLLIIFVSVLLGYTGNRIQASYYRFEFNYGYLLIDFLLGISLGLILGFEHLITEKRKTGIWRINYPKLLLVGLTALYFSISGLLIYGSNQTIMRILAYPFAWLIRFGIAPTNIFQLILGYIIITSFYKYNEQSEAGE